MTRTTATFRRISHRSLATALAGCAVLAACGGDPPPPPPPPVPVFTAQSGYARISGEYLTWYLDRHPVEATRAGAHEHDGRLPQRFEGDLERGRHELRAFLTRLEDVNRPTLQTDDRLDHRVMEYAMRAALLDLETIDAWHRDPTRYTRPVLHGTATLVEDAARSVEDRARALAARWREVPLLLRAARQNLDAARTPRLFVEQGAAEARETLVYLRDHVPAALEAQGLAGTDPATRSELEAARQAALASTDSFIVWLERDLTPRATGDFRLGAGALEQVLRHRYHIDIPVAELYALNRQAIDEYREWMGRVAMTYDPLRQPAAIVDSMTIATRGAAALIPPTLEAGRARPGAFAPPTPVRAVLPPPAMPEAWLHYLDQATLTEPALDDGARLAGIRRALHGHALVHAMLAVHTGDATLEEATRDFTGIALVSPAVASREVRRVAHDPGAGMAAIERMRIFALRERVAEARGPAFDASGFDRDVIAAGLPVALVAEAMLDREVERLVVPGVRTPGLPPLPGPLDR